MWEVSPNTLGRLSILNLLLNSANYIDVGELLVLMTDIFPTGYVAEAFHMHWSTNRNVSVSMLLEMHFPILPLINGQWWIWQL